MCFILNIISSSNKFVGGDSQAISSKERQQKQQQEQATNDNEVENLEKLGEESVLTKDQDEKEADDETMPKAIETETQLAIKTKNAEKRYADQDLQDVINRDDQIEQGRVFFSPSHPVLNDWGCVSSICKSWDENEAQGKLISGILFNHSDWMCLPGSVGNKLGLYIQTRAFASLHGVSFHITPNCSKAVDSLIPWLSQNVIPATEIKETADANVTPVLLNRTSESFLKLRNSMCNCGGPIAHQYKYGWPQLAGSWHHEIRSALDSWALTAGKPKVETGAVPIHFRCGDLMEPVVNTRGRLVGWVF
jgi:hypothetical protein